MQVSVWAKNEEEARGQITDTANRSAFEELHPLATFVALDRHSIQDVKEEVSLSDEAMSFIGKLTDRHFEELREDDNDTVVDELREAGLLYTPDNGITRLATEGIFIYEDSQKEKE